MRAANTPSPEPFLAGGGEMGALMRAMDWSSTPLGPVESWPQSLRTAVSIILRSRYPMFVWWGQQLINLYNDPYRAFLGVKHPEALGRSAREVWAEIWPQIGPRTDAVLLQGESTFDEALLLLMARHGYPEETYFTFAYSPIVDDAGRVGGLFCAVTEETKQVIGQRRLTLLQSLAAESAKGRTPEQVCELAANCLVDARRDLPFSLIYLLDREGGKLARVAAAGISGEHEAAPESIAIHDQAAPVWPVDRVLQTGKAVVVSNLAGHFRTLPTGEWEQPPHNAVLLPIAQQGQAKPAGVLIAALNPYLPFEGEFPGFVSLLANQIAASIGNATAYEQERRRAEALAEIDRAKTLFFSNISHEFRTPLTLMLGPLQEVMAEARAHLSPQALQELVVARRNALRLQKLVNTLLDFSRIEAGRVEAVYEPTDLASLTADIASVFRSAMEKAGLRFTVEAEPISEPVYVDREMWEKIVLNLISNAFKFTLEGEVAVSLRQVDGRVEFRVRDTGIGIPAHEQQRVFERFHRIENTRARAHEGTGIGLALVQELVRLHGGTVKVESTVGRGSTFTVFIPLGKAHLAADRVQGARSAAAASHEIFVEEAQRWLPDLVEAPVEELTASKPASVAVPGTFEDRAPERELIVIADDNADMREYLARLLGRHFRVLAVADGVQAVEAARRHHPALVLADVMMPGLDGFGMLRVIRDDANLRDLPVILLSARAGEESRLEGLQAGADDYLAKPFTARELLARITTHLRMSGMRRDAAEREAGLRAQAELERHRIEDLLQQAPAGIGLLSGPEHRWTYVNDFYVRVTGRSSPADFVGKTIRESLPEVEGQGFFELLDNVYRTGEAFTGREMMVRLNRTATGQPEDTYFNFMYQPVRDAEGNIEGILVHSIDVTDHVLARRELERSKEEFRALANAMPQLVWMANSDGWIYWYNQRWYDYTGATPEQMQGWGWQSVHDPAVLPEVMEKWRAAIASGERFEMTFPLRGHDGKFRPFLSRAVPVRDAAGRVLRWFGTNTDISIEIEIQDELRRSRERLQLALVGSQRLVAIVESSDDAIVSKDLRGIVTSWNPAAERMFGYTAKEMIGRSITTIIPPELQDDEQRILATIGRGDRIEHFETQRVTKSGQRIDVALTISPVKDDSGKIVGAAKIARDITQRKRTEQALRISERLASVGRLAATVAHEINNPLEAVTNLVYLARKSPNVAQASEYLAIAEEELDRISHLTRQTLGFYRETRGAVVTRIGEMIAPLVTVFSSRARNRSIEIRTEIKQDPEIFVVPGEIRQLLANLLANSIDAIEGGGTIRIRVSAAADHRDGHSGRGVRLTIADTGPGIPDEIRARLFEPFFTLKKDVGTGLGLWVCKSVVDKHLGSIRVKSSTASGCSWTAFSVFLPAQAPALLTEEPLRQAV